MAEIAPAQILILKICGGVIAVGLGLLAIDEFIVKRGEPSRQERLQVVSQELGLDLHDPYSLERIKDLTEPFGDLVEPAVEVGAALTRTEEDHQLIAYEHRYRDTALNTGTQTHDTEVEVLVILARLPGADLPSFAVFPDGSYRGDLGQIGKALGTDAWVRMRGWREFAMGAEGETVIFAQLPPNSPLAAGIARRQSADFYPGLLNSGFKVDLQRAVDIVNLMPLDRQRLAAVYQIDIGEIKVELPELNLTSDMQAITEETHRKTQAIVDGFAEDLARIRAESEQRQAEIRAEFQEKLKRIGNSNTVEETSDDRAAEEEPET